MSSDTAARVHYFDKQFLRVDEFRDEQLYQLAQRRRHNNTQHIWGIVRGLEIAKEDETIVVQPGLAIDGYGRELLLTAKQSVAAESFDDHGSDRLDLWLIYARTDDGAAPDGYGECGASGAGGAYRSSETPQLLVERALSNTVDPRRPPGVPRDVLDAPVPPVTDDPQSLWRVYLGRLIRQEDLTVSIDLSRRPYVGVVGEAIDHPANATRVEIGRTTRAEHERTVGGVTYTYKTSQTRTRYFGVLIPDEMPVGEGGEIEVAPRLEVLDEDEIALHGRTSVHGNVRVSGGAVQFVTPASFTLDDPPQDPSFYRYTDGGKDELRIDLGAKKNGAVNFVIGFSAPDGKFTPCLTVALQKNSDDEWAPVVTIDGDLVIAGKLTAGEVLDRAVSAEAEAAFQGAFAAGLAAANIPS